MDRARIVLHAVFLLLAGMLCTRNGWAGDGVGVRRVLVGFKRVVGSDARASVVHAAGGDVSHAYHLLSAVSAMLSEEAVERLNARPDVAYVEEDAVVRATEQMTPWGVDRIDADLVWGLAHGNAGAGIDVAILDTGITMNHPDLRVAGGVNFQGRILRDGSTKPEDWNDTEGHGTHCAGIVGALNNGLGLVGVAPECNLWAVRVLDDERSGYVSDVIQGLEWCVDHGIEIVSMSFAGAESESLERACQIAADAGLLLVAATGNDGGAVHPPAAYETVVAVSAVDSAGLVAAFSNGGPQTELAAPGVNIRSTYRDGQYATISGTSMACPHVAGVAALVWSSSELGLGSADAVRARLRETAEALPSLDPARIGYGLVDAESAVGTQCPVVDVVVAELAGADMVVRADAVQFAVTVENTGNRNVVDDIQVIVASDGTTPLVTADDTTIAAHTIVGGLAAGESVAFECAWDTAGAPVGTHTVTARHDAVDDDATNDARQIEVAVWQAVTDLAVTAIEMPEVGTPGEAIEVVVDLENLGNRDVTKYVQVALTCDNATPGATGDDSTIGVQTLVRGLAIGGQVSIPFTWHSSRAAAGTYTLTATLRIQDDNAENDSRAATLTLEVPQPELTVSRVSPHAIRAGTTTTIIVSGAGFDEDADVVFESVAGPSPTVIDVTGNSPNTLLVRVRTATDQPPVPVVCDVRVANPDGSAAVLREALTVRP